MISFWSCQQIIDKQVNQFIPWSLRKLRTYLSIVTTIPFQTIIELWGQEWISRPPKPALASCRNSDSSFSRIWLSVGSMKETPLLFWLVDYIVEEFFILGNFPHPENNFKLCLDFCDDRGQPFVWRFGKCYRISNQLFLLKANISRDPFISFHIISIFNFLTFLIIFLQICTRSGQSTQGAGWNDVE